MTDDAAKTYASACWLIGIACGIGAGFVAFGLSHEGYLSIGVGVLAMTFVMVVFTVLVAWAYGDSDESDEEKPEGRI